MLALTELESGLVSEPVLTPFRSVLIQTPITHLLCLTLISLYCFRYLHSGPTRPFSPCCSLDLVVRLPCFLFRTSLCRYQDLLRTLVGLCSYVRYIT